jgi:hypothetical protein
MKDKNMDKDNCKIGQKVLYTPSSGLEGIEFGVVTEIRDSWAMVLYGGDTVAKSTRYEDLDDASKFIEQQEKARSNE